MHGLPRYVAATCFALIVHAAFGCSATSNVFVEDRSEDASPEDTTRPSPPSDGARDIDAREDAAIASNDSETVGDAASDLGSTTDAGHDDGACPVDCDGKPVAGCKPYVPSDRMNCGTCGHACAGLLCFDGLCDGENVEDAGLNAITKDGSGLWLLSEDPLYIDRLQNIPSSGSAPIEITKGAGIVEPWTETLVLDDKRAYWLNDRKGYFTEIYAVAKDGKSPAAAVDSLKTDPCTGQCGLAVDAHYLYFVRADGIWRWPVAGGASELWMKERELGWLQADDTNVYFAGAYGDIFVRAKSSPPGSITSSPALQIASGKFSRFQLVDGAFYWADGDLHQVVRQRLPSGAPEVVTTPGYEPYFAWIDGDDMFMLSAANRALVKAPKAGGGPITVLGFGDGIRGLAADDTYVYYGRVGIQRLKR